MIRQHRQSAQDLKTKTLKAKKTKQKNKSALSFLSKEASH